ncbi:MAG: DoxX family protein [Simkaniaceae bacterium]|nr:MAG: DoxX family protein [Simkaniaceae bacterium]
MKHLFFIRLIAGVVLLIFGILHFIRPENFQDILIATDTPMLEFNLYFVPIVEVIVGIFFIIGFLTRLSAIVGTGVMTVAAVSTIKLMKMTPENLPDGLTEVPFSPPLFIPIVIGLMSIYLIFMGAGAWGIDKAKK